jgi:UDP-N-acetylmuramate--alanine ligase
MNIYFSGIGGVGIGPLAEIAFDAGYNVSGSDIVEGLITNELRARGITVSIGQDGEFLQVCHDSQPIDWLVYTSSLPKDHPELVLAKQLGIKTAKRDELIAHIIAEKNLKLIAIAGTHGKTTTTGMLVWAMQQLNIPVSYSVGTTLSFGPSGKYTPNSEYFVYECDEFDRNFLHFHPHVAIITSVDYDHPDTYPTESDYTRAFSQFIDQSKMAIMWQRDSSTIEPSKALENAWVLQDEEVATIKLAGAHNRRNATLVLKTLEYLKIASDDAALNTLNSFPGTNRRFEKLADNIYSDYGHHPAEIAATLQMARELSDHVTLVYQPHQNVRQHEIRGQYTDCFSLAEDVYWLPTYLSREDPDLAILTPQELSQNVTNKNAVHIAELDEKLWNDIKSAQASSKLVLAMGAGNIDGWLRDRLAD